MKLIKKSNLTVLLRFVLGGILLYSSFEKIADPSDFARDISNYHLAPFGLENLMALILPWVEFVAGLALIFGIAVDGASFLTLGMMIMFILAIGQAILRGFDIECGCGLKAGQKVGLDRIAEDIIYLAMAWLVYKRKERRFEIYPKSV